MLNGVFFSSDLFSAHGEDHLGTSAVLYSSVTTELDNISWIEHLSDVVAILKNLSKVLECIGKFWTLGNSALVGKNNVSTGTSV